MGWGLCNCFKPKKKKLIKKKDRRKKKKLRRAISRIQKYYVKQHPIFKNKNIPKLYVGLAFIFTGVVRLTCDKFCIIFRLDNSHQDIALLISPHILEHYIVRNNRVGNVWAVPDITTSLAFSLNRGAMFTIQTLVTETCYMISVNGHHLAEYGHRIPYISVTSIEVTGDIDLQKVQYAELFSYPENEIKAHKIPLTEKFSNADDIKIPSEFKLIPNSIPKSVSLLQRQEVSGLPVPYYGHLPKQTLTDGRCLRIEGRVKMLPRSFYVDLQCGRNLWPHPVIAFRFNLRYKELVDGVYKNIVCCNAWYDGQWSIEDRSDLNINLPPGGLFSLFIVHDELAYEVYVNRRLTTKFKSHVKPQILDTVCIWGDVKLWGVFLVKTAHFKSFLQPLQT